ncbi:hypothetical protein SMICM17S_05175 [Streptomyces microflavus]
MARDEGKGEAITQKKKADKKDEAAAESSRVRGLSMLEEALEHLVKGIVDNPDDVQVASRNLRRGRVLEVRVHPDDLGKVIGRNGRTARALRTVVGAIGGRGVRVDLVDVAASADANRSTGSGRGRPLGRPRPAVV